MEPIEARRFELAQPIGNDAGPPTKAGRDSRAGVNREAVRQQLPTAKCTGVRDDLCPRSSPTRRIVGATMALR